MTRQPSCAYGRGFVPWQRPTHCHSGTASDHHGIKTGRPQVIILF